MPRSTAATLSSDVPAGVKRTATSTSSPAAPKKAKRARLAVDPGESEQVTSLGDEYRLPLADADCFYVPDLVDEETAQAWHDELVQLDEWYRPTLKVYGKEVVQSRKIAVFATDPSLEVKYSGHPVKMSYEYPPLLRKIQDLVEERLGVTFNSAFCNLYEDGSVYIGKHRDNRENRVIASLSLGAARTFILTHTKPPPSAASPIPSAAPVPSDPPAPAPSHPPAPDPPAPLYAYHTTLTSGSLLVMQGAMQQHWKHEIPREKRAVKASRVSLTFRQLVF